MRISFEEVKKQVAAGAGFVPVIEELAYPQATPEQIFRALPKTGGSDGEGQFFFHTGAAGATQGGVSYIGLDPFETLKVRGGADIRSITERLAQYRAFRQPGLPFFQGGAFGTLNYDFVRHLEPRLKKSGYFRSLEAAQAAIDAELMFFHKLLIFDRDTRRAYALAGIVIGSRNFSAEELHAAYKSACENLDALKTLVESVLRETPSVVRTDVEVSFESMQAALGPEKFAAGVRELKEGIRAGDIFQAVLSDRFTLDVKASADEVFQALGQVSASPYRFHFRSAGRDLLGASPEMLIRVNNETIETHPIAGTRPRGRDQEEDLKLERQLLRSPKERAEHLMLVDLARNDVGRVARPGTVSVAKYRELLKFGGVMHLVSRVQGLLQEGRTAFEALTACFPAGTLSGAPKVRAMELIAGIEPVARGFYGGAIVAAAFTGDLDSCIAIRTMEIEGGRATLQAGAGIVADSRADREYAEIRHKTRALRQAIAIAESAAKKPAGRPVRAARADTRDQGKTKANANTAATAKTIGAATLRAGGLR